MKWKLSLYWHVWFQWISIRNMLSPLKNYFYRGEQGTDRKLRHMVQRHTPSARYQQNQWACGLPPGEQKTTCPHYHPGRGRHTRLFFLRRLRSFSVSDRLLQIFYLPVFWLHGLQQLDSDLNDLNKLLRKASEEIGCEVDRGEAAVERRRRGIRPKTPWIPFSPSLQDDVAELSWFRLEQKNITTTWKPQSPQFQGGRLSKISFTSSGVN